MKAPFLYLLLVLPLLAVRCPREKTDDPKPLTPLEQLPPATMEGKDTFGCLVNNEPWVVYGKSQTGSNVDADWTLPNLLSIYLDRVVIDKQVRRYYQVTLGLTDSISTGNHQLQAFGGADARLSISGRHYSPENLIEGHLILTRLDRQARICSGTFEFTMVGAPGDTVRVTHGRFDISRMAL